MKSPLKWNIASQKCMRVYLFCVSFVLTHEVVVIELNDDKTA